MHRLSSQGASFAVALILAGCGVLRQPQDDMQPPVGMPDAAKQSSQARSVVPPSPPRPSYDVLHKFGNHVNRLHDRGGANPDASALINVSGTLYGTTAYGGVAKCYWGCGTVYSISTTGAKKTLHRFGGGRDGELPVAGLTDVKGTLYGTTLGGSSGNGTVFSLTTAGVETVLYSFKGGPKDGSIPRSGLIAVNGVMYGTTTQGGSSSCKTVMYMSGCGTVYSVTASGREKVLYRFQGPPYDGANPQNGLVAVNGILYGTTFGGGENECGTVFKLTTVGSETVLHEFNCYSDGTHPWAGLIVVKGALYGTTEGGGTFGYGTVFRMSTGGFEKVLYSFAAGSDGAGPLAAVTYRNGNFYGTTSAGGSSKICAVTYTGCGTIYSLDESGSEKVLHRFQGGSDGALPNDTALVDVNGTFYGTTTTGGSSICRSQTETGCGIVFSLTP